MVSRYFVYKQALLDEAERLVRADVLSEKEDIFFLRFQELHDVVCVRTGLVTSFARTPIRAPQASQASSKLDP
jgi:hypothetical protein